MTEQTFFTRGDRIVLREIWRARVWSARPVIVVQDTPELLALYMQPGTPYEQPRTLNGEGVTPTTRLQNEWVLADALWRRTPIGFDYMGQLLDIIVEPDLSGWHWKDEDEFQEAQELGLISPERAGSMRAEGESVVEMLLSGKSIFNGWEHWKPDPSWEIPTLPEGWERV
jgi:hypothetical protein